MAGTKRGAHLAISVERLERLVEKPLQRIGLSATQRPLEEIGRFVAGGREIELVDAGRSKELDLEIVVPVEDMREPGGGRSQPDMVDNSALMTPTEGGVLDLAVHLPASCSALVREHRSTIVFVNNRRLAERLALRLNELRRRRSPGRTTAL